MLITMELQGQPHQAITNKFVRSGHIGQKKAPYLSVQEYFVKEGPCKCMMPMKD
jgi:hypothetical protein